MSLADAVDVVVAADDPDGARVFEHAAAGGQPVLGEAVIGGEVFKVVPVGVYAVDARHVGPPEVLLQLQVIGRIGENQVHALLGERGQHVAAVADERLIEGQVQARISPRGRLPGRPTVTGASRRVLAFPLRHARPTAIDGRERERTESSSPRMTTWPA